MFQWGSPKFPNITGDKVSLCRVKNWVQPGVVAGTCNPATLETEFRNCVGSNPVEGDSPSIGGWLV